MISSHGDDLFAFGDECSVATTITAGKGSVWNVLKVSEDRLTFAAQMYWVRKNSIFTYRLFSLLKKYLKSVLLLIVMQASVVGYTWMLSTKDI